MYSISEKQVRWADENDCDDDNDWEGLVCDETYATLINIRETIAVSDYTRQELSNSFYTPTELWNMERAARSMARRSETTIPRGLEALTSTGNQRLRTKDVAVSVSRFEDTA